MPWIRLILSSGMCQTKLKLLNIISTTDKHFHCA